MFCFVWSPSVPAHAHGHIIKISIVAPPVYCSPNASCSWKPLKAIPHSWKPLKAIPHSWKPLKATPHSIAISSIANNQ